MRRTKQSLEWKAQWWEQRRELPGDISVDGVVRSGITAYADRQASVQRRLANHFSDLWAGNNVLLEGADDQSERPIELSDPDVDPNSSAYGDDNYETIDPLEESMDDEGIDEDE